MHIVRSAANHGIKLERTTSNTGSVQIQCSSNGVLALTADNNIQYQSGGSQQHIFFKGSDEIARFDTSRRLLLGHEVVPRPVAGNTNRLFQIENGTSDIAGVSIVRNQAGTGGPFISFGKSRDSSTGGTTIVQNGDTLGTISFAGADGTNLESRGADIFAEVDGSPGENDMPGRLIFSTSADGSVSPTERMRIDSSGNTHFGSGGDLNDSNVVSIVPADGRISFGMDGRDSLVTGENGCYIFSGQGSSGSPIAGELVLQSRSNQDRDIFFATGSTQHLEQDLEVLMVTYFEVILLRLQMLVHCCRK